MASRKRRKGKQVDAQVKAKRAKRLGRILFLLKVLLLLAIMALCWLPALVINNAMGYLPGLFVTLGILLSGIYLQLMRRGLECQEATRASQCVRGEQVDFVVRLRNRTPLLFPRVQVFFFQSDLFGSDGRVTSSDIILAPLAKRDFVFSMRFDHLGRYRAGLQKVVLHDLLGLFKYTYEFPGEQTIDVTPRLFEMTDMEFSSESPTQSNSAVKSVLNEGMDYAMVREYRWGDPIKSIHWKISARTENYMVRIYETLTNPGLTTIVDLHAPDTDAETLMGLYDAVLESALSLDEYARANGLECTLMYRDDAGMTCSHASRVESEGMRTLAGLLRKDSSCYRGDAQMLLTEEMNSPFAQDNIALCTSSLDEGLVETLLAIKSRRRNPMLFFAIPKGLVGDERTEYLSPLRRLDEAHIPYCAFDDMSKLTLIREEA